VRRGYEPALVSDIEPFSHDEGSGAFVDPSGRVYLRRTSSRGWIVVSDNEIVVHSLRWRIALKVARDELARIAVTSENC